MIIHIDNKTVPAPKLNQSGQSFYDDEVYIKEVTMKDKHGEFTMSASTIEEEKNIIAQTVGALYSCLKNSEVVVSNKEMLESLKNRALLLDCLPKGFSVAFMELICGQCYYLEKFFDYEGELNKDSFIQASQRLL